MNNTLNGNNKYFIIMIFINSKNMLNNSEFP